MTILKRLGISSLIVLLTVSIIIDIGYLCFCLTNKDITTGINNIGDQDPLDVTVLDPEDADDPRNHEWFIEAQYYSNENGNGIELQEIKFNSFTAPTLTTNDRQRQVMQYCGNVLNPSNLTTFEAMQFVNSLWAIGKNQKDAPETRDVVGRAFNYYVSNNDNLYADWKGLGSYLTRGTKMIVKIEGKPYMIRLTGSDYLRTVNEWLWGWTPIKTGSHNEYRDYLYGQVFYDVMNGIKTNSIGEGTFYAKIDLSKYFTVTHTYDEKSKRWVDATGGVDQLFTYSGIKFTYSKNGAVSSRQSFAHIINDDPSYGRDFFEDCDYWQDSINVNLSAKDLTYRYSETHDGYLASLPMSLKTELMNTPKSTICLNLNLKDQYLVDRKINLVGLDYNALENAPINQLTISGVGDFVCLENSLKNTSLKTINAGAGVNLSIVGEPTNRWGEIIK